MWSINSIAQGIEFFNYATITSDSMGVVMKSKEVGFPEIRERNVILPNRPGVIKNYGIDPLSKYGEREIKVVCLTYIQDREDEPDFRRQLIDKLSVYGEQKLFFSWSADRYYMAEVKNIVFEDISESYRDLVLQITITFSCGSPFVYATTGNDLITNLEDELINDSAVPAETILTLTVGQNVDAGDGSINNTGLGLRIGPNKIQINQRLVVGDEIQVGDGQIILNGSSFIIPNMRWSNSNLQIPTGTFHFTSNYTMTGTILIKRRYLE